MAATGVKEEEKNGKIPNNAKQTISISNLNDSIANTLTNETNQSIYVILYYYYFKVYLHMSILHFYPKNIKPEQILNLE